MKEYDTPIASVDAVILTLKNEKLHVLLVEREKEPYAGKLGLPGGFIFTDQDETLDDSVNRVLFQKTGVQSSYFEQLHTLVLLSVILVVGLLVLLMYL